MKHVQLCFVCLLSGSEDDVAKQGEAKNRYALGPTVYLTSKSLLCARH